MLVKTDDVIFSTKNRPKHFMVPNLLLDHLQLFLSNHQAPKKFLFTELMSHLDQNARIYSQEFLEKQGDRSYLYYKLPYIQVRRVSSGSIRLRRSNSPVCRRRESRLTRISLTIVWLFLFCHIWKLIPTAFEVFYARDQTFPTWMHYIKHTSHALIVLNSSLNFLIYVII